MKKTLTIEVYVCDLCKSEGEKANNIEWKCSPTDGDVNTFQQDLCGACYAPVMKVLDSLKAALTTHTKCSPAVVDYLEEVNNITDNTAEAAIHEWRGLNKKPKAHRIELDYNVEASTWK